MKPSDKTPTHEQGLVIALSLLTASNSDDPNDPERRPDGIDPSIPKEGEDGPQDQDDLEQHLPGSPDERREDRERGGKSPIDDMDIPKDVNGTNVD